MVQESDLRVGNYFINQGGKIIKLQDIDSGDHLYLDPIPLTIEILEKAGFTVYNNNLNKVNEDGNGIGFRADDLESPCTIFGDHDYIDGPVIKYVHQLQNIYFALIGEELPIEL